MSTKEDSITGALIEYLNKEAATTKQIAQNNKETTEILKVHLENMGGEIKGVRNDFKEFMEKAENIFVTQVEFSIVKKAVLGAVGGILLVILERVMDLI